MISFTKNNRKMYSIILVFAMLFYSLFGSIGTISANTTVNSNDNIVELKILHTNDIHSHINPLGKAAAYINKERSAATHSLYLDAGDIFSGNPVVDLNNGKPIIEILNMMNLDAMAFGNHDFDYGQAETIDRIKESNFPWLSANMTVTEEAMEGFPQPEPYTVFVQDGLRIGVFSLIETPPSTAPVNIAGINFHNPIATAKEYATLKEDEDLDVLIALTHQGYSEDRRLAEAVDFFDVIIGGHSHTALATPAVVNGTPVFQVGSNALNVGNLTLKVDTEKREVVEVTGFSQPVHELTEVDEAIQERIDYHNSKMDEVLGVVIGHSTTGLSRDGRTVRDVPLGNFWTDAMRHSVNADAALTNNGGIRDSIPAGDITKGHIYTVEPFANEIMEYEMTGQALKDVIEFSYNRRNSVDLQTSGLTYKVLTNTVGQLIDLELMIDGQPIDLEKKYRVAVADYIGSGGGGYNFVGEVITPDAGYMTDAMIEYAKYRTAKGEKLDYVSEGRIKVEVGDPSAIGNVIGSTEKGLNDSFNKKGDSGLGNLYADSVRAIASTDVGLLNNSSVSGTIPAGDITDAQIQFLDSFGNEVVAVTTTVERLKEVLVTQADFHNGVDLQVSGIKYELVKENGKFVDVKVMNEAGEVLSDSTELTAAYNDFMHGRGFYNLGAEVIDTYGKVWESVIEFVTNHDGPIDYEEGYRITISGEELAPGNPGDLPEGVMTVAEAIANNSGEGIVQGYIVGTNNVFDGEFTVATNIALADDPNEKSLAKTLPVQLPNTSIRTDLNLVDNPENLGKLVHITGDLSAYFSRPGLRNARAYEFVETPEPSNKLEDIRTLAQGTTVEATGIVTSTPGAWGNKGFYIQDETAGLYVFVPTNYSGNFDVKAGDEVTVNGKLGNFNGELQVTDVTNVMVNSSNNDLPGALNLTPGQVSKDNEAQIVTLEGVTITELAPSGTFGTFEFKAVKGEESVVIRVDNRTGLHFNDFTFENGDIVTVTGASSVFNNTIQVKPRHAGDIIEYVEVIEPIIEKISIAEARSVAAGTEVTVEATVTTTPGGWGQKGFYIQDETAGMYVFQNSFDVKKGDIIRITGTKGAFNQELQISNVTSLEVIGKGELPLPLPLSPAQVSTENEAQLVMLEEVVITDLKSINSFGTFEFTAVKDGETVIVRVDNRTGLKFDDFAFTNGDVVSITGISSRFNNTIQVKPRGAEDIIERHAKADKINVSLTDGKENEVHSLARNLKINVSAAIENHSKEVNGTKDYIVSVRLIDKHGRVQFSHIDVTTVASGSHETVNSEVIVPPNHNGQRYTLEVVVYEGDNRTELDQNEKLMEHKIK
ncbi:MAG: 5'-nucleotidase C-terminal domain-containing protein [Bacillaceae bacterium]|nr:5'-nucleotidase C-terminal domain-containing protein [Bacillaceae bacterium]